SMRISVGAFIPAAPIQAIASRASRRSPAGSGPTHRQTLPLGGVCVNRTSMLCCRIDTEVGKLAEAIGRLEREIELLREYRARLTADVVTGKLDVREAAARLPNEAPPLPDMLEETDALDELEPAEEELAV